jgi:hypothetical protein
MQRSVYYASISFLFAVSCAAVRADEVYFPAAHSNCRSEFQRNYGLGLWEQGKLSLAPDFSKQVCQHLAHEEWSEAEDVMKQSFDAIKAKVGFCYALSDYEIYERINCSQADTQYARDLLHTLILTRAKTAARDLIIVLAKTQQLNRPALGLHLTYLDIVQNQIDRNNDLIDAMASPRDPLRYEALVADTEVLDKIKDTLVEWGADYYEHLSKGCRNVNLRKELIVRWVQDKLHMTPEFEAQLCNAIAENNLQNAASVIQTEFQRLTAETGYCYDIADPEIYERIDCSRANPAYARDLLSTAIKTRAESVAGVLIKALAKQGSLTQVIPHTNTLYYEALKNEINSNKILLTTLPAHSDAANEVDDKIQFLRRLLLRLERAGGGAN